jgi:hypothetical protein
MKKTLLVLGGCCNGKRSRALELASTNQINDTNKPNRFRESFYEE